MSNVPCFVEENEMPYPGISNWTTIRSPYTWAYCDCDTANVTAAGSTANTCIPVQWSTRSNYATGTTTTISAKWIVTATPTSTAVLTVDVSNSLLEMERTKGATYAAIVDKVYRDYIKGNRGDYFTNRYQNSAGPQWDRRVLDTPTCVDLQRAEQQRRFKEIIRARQAPLYLPSHRKLLVPTADARELRARATFRRIVGEHNWRTYCAKGYVSVKAASGRVYQIFAGREVTRVYEDGRLTERLCVQLQGDYCATDAILARYVLVLSDEATFRRVANHTIARYEEPKPVRAAAPPSATLVEQWNKAKSPVWRMASTFEMAVA